MPSRTEREKRKRNKSEGLPGSVEWFVYDDKLNKPVEKKEVEYAVACTRILTLKFKNKPARSCREQDSGFYTTHRDHRNDRALEKNQMHQIHDINANSDT